MIPVMIFTSVDLPAPFSPTSAWTLPRPISKETSDNAFEGPKDLLIPSMRSAGSASAIDLDRLQHAAVDEIGRADAVGRLVGAEEDEEVGELLRAAEPPDRGILIGDALQI